VALSVVQRALRAVPDLDSLRAKLGRTASGKAGSTKFKDLFLLWQSLQAAVDVAGALAAAGKRASGSEDAKVLQEEITQPLSVVLRKFTGLVQLVEKTIDISKALNQGSHRIHVRPEFDEVFLNLHKKRQASHQKMSVMCEEVNAKMVAAASKGKGLGNKNKSTKSGGSGEELVTLKEQVAGGFVCFRVAKKSYQTVLGLMSDNPGVYEQTILRKAEFLFTSAKLKVLNSEVASIDETYEKAQSQLAEKCVAVAATYAGPLEKLTELLATADVLASFGITSACSACDFSRPELSSDTEGRILDLPCAVHPLVAEKLLDEGNANGTFIGNSCFMSEKEGRLLLITGPNMGGKSTYLRTVALCALLNQIGMFVPTTTQGGNNKGNLNKPPRLPVFSSLFCRVGASDAQLLGISTFMSEMLESGAILRAIDSRSLVVVDELGRGTSTQDGYGIAYAFAKYVAMESKGAFSLFATHFLELGSLSSDLGGKVVVNKHAACAVKEEEVDGAKKAGPPKITFLYELRPGVAEQSYGGHVARLAQFPETVLEAAAAAAAVLEGGSTTKSDTENAVLDALGVQDANSVAKVILGGDLTEDGFIQALKRRKV